MFKAVRVFLLGALAMVAMCAQAFAAGSGAYRLEVSGAAAIGKGSAFVGEANNPSAVYYNPAGMTQLKGNNLSMGMAVIQPKARYRSLSDNTTQMQRDSYFIPHGYFVTDLGMPKFALGLGALSSWGLTTEWAQDSFAKYNTTRAEMTNYDYLITGAYQVSEKLSLAVGLDIDDSKVDKQKKLYQGAVDGNFRLKGASTAYGFRVAGMYKMNEKHQFGLMYRSMMEHKYVGKVHLDDLNAGGSNYQAIFGGTSYETDVISKSRLPDSVVLGYSFKPAPKWTFNADVEWMNWSLNNKEELAYPGETNATRLAILNDGNPVSRDWHSSWSAALGTQYDLSEKTRLRTGYYYHQSPIPNDTWEPNLPDSACHGVTLGVGYDLRKDLTLDVAWSGIYYEKRKVENAVNATFGGINGTYTQWSNLMYASLTYAF